MSEPFDSPEHWLKLAREARAQATLLPDEYAQRTMLLIAQRYEITAERIKRRIEEQKTKGECA